MIDDLRERYVAMGKDGGEDGLVELARRGGAEKVTVLDLALSFGQW